MRTHIFGKRDFFDKFNTEKKTVQQLRKVKNIFTAKAGLFLFHVSLTFFSITQSRDWEQKLK